MSLSDGRFPIPAFCRRTRQLLEEERDAEIAENRRIAERLTVDERAKRGLCIPSLQCDDIGFGFGGRPEIDLSRTGRDKIPDHRFQSGDVVAIEGKELDGEAPTGVLSRVWPDRLKVVLDGDLEIELRGKLRLERVANDVTHKRLVRALEDLERANDKTPGERVRKIAFEGDACDPVRPASAPLFDDSLNESQRAAVAHAVATNDVSLIHGPPGTGKTTTVAELIHQATALGERVLACAPSNIAVDNLAEKLIARGLQVVRVGHPARLFTTVADRSLDALVERSTSQKLIHDLRRDLDVAQKRMVRAHDHFERRSLRDEIRHLRRGVREIEAGVVRGILSSADCVLATLTGAGDRRKFEGLSFDLAVVDEAAQALEPAAWIALMKARRGVLAGDHKQLPPTLRSRKAEREGLGITLFERLADAHPDACHLLDVQYRMHSSIMDWASAASYENKLIAHDSVASHTLADLDGVTETDETNAPLFFIDTAGFDANETTDEDGVSRWNDREGDLLELHLDRLLEAGVPATAIGVIAPYSAQVTRLRSRLRPKHKGLEVDTVDGFQGREKEAILLSLVRSNSEGQVGFLSDQRRLNVAITRARRHCAIVADSATISSNEFLAGVVEHFQEVGEYRSAYDY